MTDNNEDRGRIFETHDALKSVASAVSYVTYQLDVAGEGGEATPERWSESMGHFQSALREQAKLSALLHEQLTRWAKKNRPDNDADRASMKEIKKLLSANEKALLTAADRVRTIRSHMQAYGTE